MHDLFFHFSHFSHPRRIPLLVFVWGYHRNSSAAMVFLEVRLSVQKHSLPERTLYSSCSSRLVKAVSWANVPPPMSVTRLVIKCSLSCTIPSICCGGCGFGQALRMSERGQRLYVLDTCHKPQSLFDPSSKLNHVSAPLLRSGALEECLPYTDERVMVGLLWCPVASTSLVTG
jgi:hypothetical protein